MSIKALAQLLSLCLLVLVSPVSTAQTGVGEVELLPPQQAFRLALRARGDVLRVEVEVADGYYMYRDRFAFVSASQGLTLGQPLLPEGELKNDPLFGEVTVYRGRYAIELPLLAAVPDAAARIEVTSQGCADIGVCYPPRTETLEVARADAPALLGTPTVAEDGGSLPGRSGGSPLTALIGGGSGEFLPPEEAFRSAVSRDADGALQVVFDIVDGYYLYRSRLGLEPASSASGLELAAARLPPGEIKEDPYLGRQEVYYRILDARYPVIAAPDAEVEVVLRYQGCAEAGLCYPPQSKSFLVSFTDSDGAASPLGSVTAAGPSGALSETDALARTVVQGSLWLVVGSFFIAGLLLAFTPCVLPMVPILSSIIAGDARVETRPARGFVLSTVYVLAMSLTYTAAGVVAGLFGRNLQVVFQHPAILLAFAAVFVLLALAMLGAYQLQLPSAWQSRLSELSHRQGGGQFAGVATMGALSALIVGPCVAAPLAAALIVIGSSGDPLRGGIALFALSLGMGAPLIVFGTVGARMLPRAGPWMELVKRLFGVMMLAVAVYLLSRLLPDAATLALWALLAGYTGWLVWRAIDAHDGALKVVGRALAGALAAYAVLLVVGSVTGAHDPLRPLAAVASERGHPLAFRRVGSVDELDRLLAAARERGRPVMLDYYADWCVSCKEMENDTFTDARVQAALESTELLQIDVTAYDDDDKALLERYGLYGPPAILFFDALGRERRARRVIGFMDADGFQRLLSDLALASG